MIVIVLNMLCINCNLVIFLSVVTLEFSFYFELYSVYQRVLLSLLVGADWYHISLEFEELIGYLILNVEEIQGQSTCGVLCYF